MLKTFSPDHYEELLEKYEDEFGYEINDWSEGELSEFTKEVTGDDPIDIEFDPQMFLITYTTNA